MGFQLQHEAAMTVAMAMMIAMTTRNGKGSRWRYMAWSCMYIYEPYYEILRKLRRTTEARQGLHSNVIITETCYENIARPCGHFAVAQLDTGNTSSHPCFSYFYVMQMNAEGCS